MKYCLIINRLGSFADLERLYVDFNHLLSNPRIDELDIDLSLITFVTPECVLALVCVTRCWYRNHLTPVRLISMNEQILQYLHRIDLFLNVPIM
jgi:hypothetical protein